MKSEPLVYRKIGRYSYISYLLPYQEVISLMRAKFTQNQRKKGKEDLIRIRLTGKDGLRITPTRFQIPSPLFPYISGMISKMILSQKINTYFI